MTDSSSAAQRALNVVELLEWILLDLPMKDLLLAKRVNRTFRATIEHSPRLQEALWLRFTSSATSHDDNDLKNIEINPLLASSAAMWSLSCLTWSASWMTCIEIRISSEGLARLRQEASFSNMLMWDSCAHNVIVDVAIYDAESKYYKLELRSEYGELELEKPPTVMELVEIVFTHQNTTRWTTVSWFSGSEGRKVGEEKMQMIRMEDA